jgi:hypothetical protein
LRIPQMSLQSPEAVVRAMAKRLAFQCHFNFV